MTRPRVLLGPDQHYIQRHLMGGLPANELDLQFFDAVEPGAGSEEILSQLPVGWEPEVVLWVQPEYFGCEGAADLPGFTCAVVVDWNLNPTFFPVIPAHFDAVLCDKLAAGILEAHGASNAVPCFQSHSYSERGVYRGETKDLDVVHIRYPIYLDRDIALTTVVDLAGEYEVMVDGPLPKRLYDGLTRRARIVVENTTKLEIPGRAYEAMAGQALYLCEAGNLEMPARFVAGQHYDTYADSAELRRKIVYYLEHEEERQRVVEAAAEAVKPFAPPHPLRQHVEAALHLKRTRGAELTANRAARDYEEAQLLADLALFSFNVSNTANDRPARREVARASMTRLRALQPDSARVANNLAAAMVRSRLAGSQAYTLLDAIGILRGALASTLR